MQSPRTAQGIRDLVATLPLWDLTTDDDPNWVRPTTEYGYISVQSPVSKDIDVENPVMVDLDSAEIKYSGQPNIRLDALLHYIDNDELFDPSGWFGNDYPVVVRWLDGYRVLDGNHRVLADRIMGRRTKAILAD